MDRGARQATAHVVAKSQTRLSDIHKRHIHDNKGKQGLTEPVSHLSLVFFSFFKHISLSGKLFCILHPM